MGKGRPGGNPDIGSINPTLLTEQVQHDICAALSGNQTIATAASLAGVKADNVYAWLRKGAPDDAPEPYATFHKEVMKAMAIGEGKLVQSVTLAAERDPKIALALLEKRYRKDWGRTETIEHVGQTEVVIELVWPSSGGDQESEIATPVRNELDNPDVLEAEVLDAPAEEADPADHPEVTAASHGPS